MDIIDDMLAGVGWSIEEYCEWGEKFYYPPLPNGHRLFVYDIRCIAVRAAVAMGEEGDAVVILFRLLLICCRLPYIWCST